MIARQTVLAVYEAFARGDLAAVLERLDDGVAWRLAESHPYNPEGQTWQGHEAVVARFFARAAADWRDFAVDLRSVREAGGLVVVEVRYTGTFAATGAALDAEGCHLWTVQGGRVTGFRQYVDTARLRGAAAP